MIDESSLECSGCEWTGQESDAKQIDAGSDDSYFECPKCGEMCAHFPLDELTEVAE